MWRRVLRVFAWVAAGVAGLVLLAVGFFAFVFDWNWVKGPLAERAGGTLHRGVAIDGPIQVHFGRVIRVRLEGVRVANAPWAATPDMADFAVIDLGLRLGSIFSGPLELTELVLTRPSVDLEKNRQGEANWEFSSNPQAAAAEKAVVPQTRTEVPLIDRLVIQQGRMRYIDPSRGIDLDSTVDTASGGDPAHALLHLAARGSVQGLPALFDLTAGSLLELKAGSAPYPLRLLANVGNTRAALDGTVTEPLQMKGINIRMTLSGQDLAEVFPIFGIPLPHTRPYALEGVLSRQDSVWVFHRFRGTVGASDLEGNLSMATGGARPRLQAALVSTRLDIADLGGLVGAAPSGETPKKPGHVLPNTPINLDKLRTMDMDVAFTGQHVEAPHMPIERLDAHLVLDRGRAQISPLSFTVADGTFAGTLVLDGNAAVPAIRVDMQVSRVDLRRFLAGTRFAADTNGIFAGRLELSGRGHSTADILGHSDGHVSLFMAGGQFSHLLLAAAGLAIDKVLGIELTGDNAVPVRCFVADFGVAQGRMGSRALVLDTTSTVVTGQGTINLDSESLDLRLLAHPKSPSLLSARAPVLVRGTLAHPDIGIDTKAEAARGAAAAVLGALLTPLGALLPFIDLGLGHDSHCHQLIGQAGAP